MSSLIIRVSTIGARFPATGFVDAGTRKRLENYYRGANRALAEELGLPLAQYR